MRFIRENSCNSWRNKKTCQSYKSYENRGSDKKGNEILFVKIREIRGKKILEIFLILQKSWLKIKNFCIFANSE